MNEYGYSDVSLSESDSLSVSFLLLAFPENTLLPQPIRDAPQDVVKGIDYDIIEKDECKKTS